MIGGNRQGLAVWLHSLKYARQLRRYGNVHYVSKKMKYVILYCNAETIDDTVERLESNHYVKSVKKSMRPFIKTEYQNSQPDKAKEYDYRMGL
ncbi:YlbG family protein [Desertibacillus haloalkaliphilus]|uniref:YlbG family protein n=1 Tax=Desertibacillus haloalkaliphilus TaxID=1328930 RepID=UPI001C263640|nr:YlbG family protein [Desertibacillus haloalkaliphilus]MBU8907137.1 YlbG family protein [Desertibacillus haloalkaliphilus]